MPDDSQLAGSSAPQPNRRKLEQEKLDGMESLAREMAHDFNNILMVILGQSELGLLTTPDDSPARVHFAHIQTASLRAAELCRQLAAYAGQVRLSLATFDPTALLRDVGAGFQPTVVPSAAFESELAPQLPPVAADADQLRTVLQALLANAREALPSEGGVVILRSGVFDADQAYLDATHPPGNLRAGRHVFVEVADNGCGLDEATQARIFDPFFSTKSKHPGLGLSTLSGIVRAHRGAVHVESAVGQGSKFRLLLPAADGPAETSAELRKLLSD